MHPLLIITVVVLIVQYALAWHDQPARNDRRTDDSSSKVQPGVNVAPQLKTGS
jgi:hypothetical protein